MMGAKNEALQFSPRTGRSEFLIQTPNGLPRNLLLGSGYDHPPIQDPENGISLANWCALIGHQFGDAGSRMPVEGERGSVERERTTVEGCSSLAKLFQNACRERLDQCKRNIKAILMQETSICIHEL